MNASQYAGTVIVPTLSRIVLCAAFFTAGWSNIFSDAKYSPDEVQVLQKLNIQVTQSMAMNQLHPGIIAVSLPSELTAQNTDPVQGSDAQAADSSNAQQPPAQDTPIGDGAEKPQSTPKTTPATPTQETKAPSTTASADSETFEARALYRIAVSLDKGGWQYAAYLAWAAALTELLGGALLLIGLFSRVWGLGIAITMAMAFHVTSMDAYLAAPFEIAQGHDGGAMFHQVYAQLALFVLAFGIFITGPGPLSLDRAIFRRTGPAEVEIDMHEPT